MGTAFRALKLAVLGAMVLTLATPAWATLTLNFDGTNNGTTITGGTLCVDNTACDTNSAVGQISTTTTLGTLSLTSTSGSSSSPTGAEAFQLIGTPSATGTFHISISDNAFTTPSPTSFFLGANVSGNSAPNVGGTGVTGNVSGVGFFSSSNVDFATNGTATSTAGPVAFQAGTQQGNAGPISGSAPYSLTEYVTIVITGLATTTDKTFQINGNVATSATPAVPEPSSVSLLGGVLLLAGVAIQRRMAKRALLM
jgi:hypothetical protein